MKTKDISVLVVDDDPLVRTALERFVLARGYTFEAASTVAEATAALAARPADVVLLDLYLPDGWGFDVLERALELDPAPVVMVMTARAEIRSAVDAIHRGAADYLEKPLDFDALAARLDTAYKNTSMRRRLDVLEAERAEQVGSAVTASPQMKEVFSIAARIAATPSSTALLLGESGVGKEVVANRIHELSERRKGPFVRVNLAAIAESMIEAELFGSVRGAYTDSKRDRAGFFATAEGGTLLLDEVCEFKPELQPKLLRALEERRFFPVGSDHERRFDVRVLAATNRIPSEMIAEGRLREDLYYRLSTVVVRIPPLRQRREDILPLAEHFLARFRAEVGRAKASLTKEAAAALMAYGWPGNVRELRNVIERAVILATSDTLEASDLDLPIDPATIAGDPAVEGGAPVNEPVRLEDVEKRHIARVLQEVDGSKTRAAAILGISRSTLFEKVKRYGLA